MRRACVCRQFLRYLLFLGILGTLLAPSAEAAGTNSNYNNSRQRAAAAAAARRAAAAAAAAKATIAQKENEIAAAKNVKAAAEHSAANAQSKASAADAAKATVLSARDDTTKAVAEARRQLDDVALRILAAAKFNSPYPAAKDKLERYRAELNKARDQVLQSPEYMSRYNSAKSSSEAASQMAAVRKEALAGDAQYVTAEKNFLDQQAEVDQLERELFSQNSEWIAATNRLRQLLPTVADSKDRLLSTSLQGAAARNTQRNAEATAAAAAAEIRSDQAAMKAAEQKLKNANNSRNNYNNRYRR